MKLRIKSNSVRYRLTRSDVKQLVSTGYLEDKVNFGETSLFYAIKLTHGEQLSTAFADNTVTLFMPQKMIVELEKTERVGFGNINGTVHLLVEKDFTCMDDATENQNDTYPNPRVKKLL